jgi:hypothetical protein
MYRPLITLAGSIAILTLTLLASPGSVFAGTANYGFDHNGGSPDINAGPAVTAAGGNVVVSVVIDIPAEGLGAWRFDIRYDDRVFTAATGPGDCVAYFSGICNPVFGTGVVRFVGTSVPGLTGFVKLADIKFDAVGAGGECSDLFADLDTLILTDDLGSPLDFMGNLGDICIEGTIGVLGFDHDGAPLDINGGPLNVSAGGMTTMQLVTEAPPTDLGAWSLDVHYQPAILEPTACAPHPGAPGGSACNIAFGPEEVRVVGADASGGVNGTFNLADITFKAKGTVGSCSPVWIEVVDYYGNTMPPISLTPEVFDGQICIVAKSADVDGNGSVDRRDVTRIVLRAIFGPYEPLFDLNADQRINVQDVLLAIQQWLRL